MELKSKHDLEALRKWVKLEVKYQLAKEYYGAYDSKAERKNANEAFEKLCNRILEEDRTV